MKTMKFAAVLLLAAAAALPAFAQQPPVAARGFDPDKVFAAGPIDSINEFNGNVIASIPLGETYAVSPTLSYSFKAIHNGKTWDYVKRVVQLEVLCENGPCTTPLTLMEAIPDGTANAGFGWRVEFARYIDQGDLQANMDRPLLETPDGAQHGTYVSLHDGDAQDGAAYTRDGTYVRMRQTGAVGHMAVDTAEGVTYEFTDKKLMQMHDQMKDGSGNFVNHVDIQYGSVNGDLSWPCSYPTISQKVTDTKGRSSYVCFQNMNYDGTNLPAVTDVYLGTPAGTGHYALTQVPTEFGRENFDKDLQYLYFSPTVTVPALMSITMPDGSSYGFEYFGTWAHPGIATGNFESITLPTKGSYGYDYGYYQVPASYDCTTTEEWLTNSYNPGITKREQRDGDANRTIVGRTYYGTNGLNGGIDGGSYQCTTEQEGPGYFTAFAPGAELSNFVIPGDNHSKTVHYYSVWPGYNRLMVDSPDGFKRVEYGLPVTRRASTMRDGLFLSTETYLCTDALNAQCSASPIRATYVQYDVDAYVDHTDISTLDHNSRMKQMESVYFDDVDPVSNAPKITTSTVSNDDFDGLGHYRVSETAGFGAASKRRTTTDYNPNAGTFPGTHTLPLTTSPWLLNLFTYGETKELDTSGALLASAKTEVCFDGNNGFLKRKRTIAGGTTDPTHDLLAVFDANGNGEVATESYYGGDRSPLPSGFDTCTTSISGPQYRITHDYASGVMTRSQYDGTTFNSFDVDVYPSTSAISTSRDTAGRPTTYVYDALGRVTEIHPQGAAWTEFEYNIPTTSSGVPSVAVRQRPEGTSKSAAAIAEQRYYFDGLGRLIQRKSAMPNNQWATVNRTYDFMGRLAREYVPYFSPSPEFDMPFTPSAYTEYTYDDLGRNTVVKAPDGKQTTTAYFAASQQRRTSGVATGVNQETPQTTRYIYDYLGRLKTVKEKNETITTGYSYDIGNHLSYVQMDGPEGSQGRSFAYDNRGLLMSESHPENGTTTYGDYDARGHAGSKTVNSADSLFDLTFTYDSAERPLQIKSRDPNASTTFRVSKELTYASANPNPFDLAKGKLLSATRYNYEIPGAGPVALTEEYEYINPAGRLSDKTTTIAGIGAAPRKIYQHYEFNDLGLLSKLPYPSPDSYGTPTWGTLFPGYAAGRFVGASATGFFPNQPNFTNNDITYWPNGMLHSVTHNNGVTDTYSMDATTGMPRPSQITFENWTAPISCTPPAIVSQSGGATVFYNDPQTISVTATGDALTYQWYQDQTPISGATGPSYAVTTTQTHSYWVRVANACNHADSTAITVTVRLRPPTALLADRAGTTSINVYWQQTNGATSYQVFRESGGSWSLAGSAVGTTFTDNPGAGATFVYRVVALGSNVTTSDYSNTDIESTLAFTTVTTGMVITYAQFDELRAGLNALRWAAGDPPWSWSQLNTQSCAQAPVVPQQGGVIYAAHILALRCAMDTALQRLGVATRAYTDPNVTGVAIKAVHVRELQQRTDYQGDNR
jgi:YD repeat-containing protein